MIIGIRLEYLKLYNFGKISCYHINVWKNYLETTAQNANISVQ